MRFITIWLLIGLVTLSTVTRPSHAQAETVGGQSIGDPFTPELGNTGYDTTHYDLSMAFDFEKKFITATAKIDLTVTFDTLTRFSFDFSTLKATSVKVGDQDAPFEQQDKAQKLVITLPTAAKKGDQLTVTVAYSGTPVTFRSRYLPFLFTGLYFDDEARRVFTINEPDGAHSVFPCNDHPRDRATYTFHLTVPADRMGVANGEQTGAPTVNPNGTQTYHWAMPDLMATYLAVVAVAEYKAMPLPDGGSGIPVKVYAYEQDALAAVNALSETGMLIKLESELFGPYPFKSYSQVLVDQRAVGLEAQTMTVLPDTVAKSEPVRIRQLVDHELAHQWFGDAIVLENWQEIWLNESFATYAEYLVSEKLANPASTRRILVYWENAIRLNTGQSAVARPVISQMFGINSYQKGGFVLHMLRLEIGDQAFFDLLKTYVKRFSGKTATSADFEALASEISGKKLVAFFDTWLRRADMPTARLTWTQSGSGTVEALICQITKEPFTVAIPVTLSESTEPTAKTDSETLALSTKAMRVTYTPGFVVRTWEIDPANVTLATVNVQRADQLPSGCGNS